MDEKKLKIAFLKVRNDYNALAGKFDDLKSSIDDAQKKAPVESDIERSLRKLDKVDFEKFTSNLEREFKNINKIIDDFNKRFIETGEIIKKFSHELEKYNVEIDEIKKHLAKTSNTAANTDLDIGVMNDQLGEYQELLREKVDLEMGAMRMEFTEEIAKLYDKIDARLSERTAPKKKAVKKKPSKKKVRDVDNDPNIKQAQPGKIKKAVSWLINGDEEDEFSDIKSEIRKK